MVWQESEIATARINNLAATNALLIQAAIGAALSKEGQQHFRETIADLTEG